MISNFLIPYMLIFIYIGITFLLMAVAMIIINIGKKNKKSIIYIIIFTVMGFLCFIPILIQKIIALMEGLIFK